MYLQSTVVYVEWIHNHRGVSEWLMVRSWKGRVGATPPWVRIPSPLKKRSDFCLDRFLLSDCIFLSSLLGSYVVIERYKAPKNPALCLFSKVGNKLTQTTPKVTFLALFYSFLHYSCILLHSKSYCWVKNPTCRLEYK